MKKLLILLSVLLTFCIVTASESGYRIYRTSDDTTRVQIETNNTDTLAVVGIKLLNNQGDTVYLYLGNTTDGNLELKNTGKDISVVTPDRFKVDINNTNRLQIDSLGAHVEGVLFCSDSIAIGATSPNFDLDVQGSINSDGGYYYKGQMTTAQEILTGGQSVESGQISGGDGAANYNLFAGGNPIVHIESDSSVGIGYGVSNHSERLAVNGDMSLLNGTNINDFSTDTTLAGNSDNAIPTEKAIKTYIDDGVDAETKYLNESASANFSFSGGLEAGYHIYSIVIQNLDDVYDQPIKVEMGGGVIILDSVSVKHNASSRILFSSFTNKADFNISSDQNIVVTNSGGSWFEGISITITIKKIWDN